MIIKSVCVKHYRSILDETLPCERLTALVGPNGSGKSSFLSALELFYSTSPKFSAEDFYAGDISEDIRISVSFTDLDDEENERFSSYIENGDLTVVRIFTLADVKPSSTYHGFRLQDADFAPVRQAGKAAEKKAAYEALRKQQKYADLPKWSNQDEANATLKAWEVDHPDQCTRQADEGQFFGFTEVAQGYLGRYTRFISIPAVRDAADDASESKGSPISEIMDLVVRNTLANRDDVTQLKKDTQEKYDEIMANLAEIDTLARSLTQTLKVYVPDAGVNLSWIKASGIEIPMPKADVKLTEDGFSSAVVRTGHGLQRAFILTMLQHLAVARTPKEAKSSEEGEVSGELQEKIRDEPRMPNLILGIEEPELYQHPNRQRHLAKVLYDLASGNILGVARKTQVIYGTHSPLFVGIDRFDQVRLLRKVAAVDGKPKTSNIKDDFSKTR